MSQSNLCLTIILLRLHHRKITFKVYLQKRCPLRTQSVSAHSVSVCISWYLPHLHHVSIWVHENANVCQPWGTGGGDAERGGEGGCQYKCLHINFLIKYLVHKLLKIIIRFFRWFHKYTCLA